MNYKAGGVTIIETAVKVLDEKDQELIEALEAIGIRRNVATIIVYLKDLDEAIRPWPPSYGRHYPAI
jgi:hypothetical protein